MTTYNWLTLFSVPGMIMALGSFILLQIKQNKAMKDGIKAIARQAAVQLPRLPEKGVYDFLRPGQL